MSASIPETVPVFTVLMDDIDDILAEHQNDPNDEISALATAFGMLGKPQSWGIDFNAAHSNAQAPIIIKASASTLTVLPGVCWIKNSGQSIRLPRRNTGNVTITAANWDGNGSLATGWVYVYAVADAIGTTFTIVISASASAPTGATNYELIGWFYNETSSAIDITHAWVGNNKANGRDVPNDASVIGSTDITTTSSSYSDMTDMTLRLRTSGRPVLMWFDTSMSLNANNQLATIGFDINGATVKTKAFIDPSGGAFGIPFGMFYGTKLAPLAAGEHTLKVIWKTSGNTLAQGGATVPRTMYAMEI